MKTAVSSAKHQGILHIKFCTVHHLYKIKQKKQQQKTGTLEQTPAKQLTVLTCFKSGLTN